MDRKMKTNPDSLPSTPAVLLPYCRDRRDLAERPEHWMGEEKDIPPDRRLVEVLLNSRNEINAKDDGKYRKIFCGT